MEPDPRYRARPPAHVGAEQAGTESARVGDYLHRYRGLCCLRKLGLPASQSPRSDHQSAFIVIKAASEFKDKATAVHQPWQTDFTYLKVIGWGWMVLSTILDDFSRYVVAWKLCTTMTSRDVAETLQLALQASGCDQADLVHKPRLLSDNGSSYLSNDLADWLSDNGMSHVRGAPYHPQTQGVTVVMPGLKLLVRVLKSIGSEVGHRTDGGCE